MSDEFRKGDAARPVGEGKYAIVKHQNHAELAYILEMPEQPGEAQKEFKDPRPFGGKVISYTCTYIIQLVHRSANTSSVDARLVKSPLRGFGWHPLMIVERGFEDRDPYFVNG